MNLKLNPEGCARLAAGHPWIRQSELSRGGGSPPQPGLVYRLQDDTGDFLAHAVSDGPGRDPMLRVLSKERHPEFNLEWAAARLDAALAHRGPLPKEGDTALRLVHGEADGLPGFFADWAGGALLLDIQSPGMEILFQGLEGRLWERLKPRALWKKNSKGSWACLKGDPKPHFQATLGGLRFFMRMDEENPWDFSLEGAGERERISRWKNRIEGRAALILFSRGGAWGAAAMAAGASEAALLDLSFQWQERAKDSLALAEFEGSAMEEDAFKALGKFASQGKKFGLIAADCPRLAKSPVGRFKTLADWLKMAKTALPLLEEGGLLCLRLRCEGATASGLSNGLAREGYDVLEGAAAYPGFREMPAWPEGSPGLQVAATPRRA